jgi:hypothetical protein
MYRSKNGPIGLIVLSVALTVTFAGSAFGQSGKTMEGAASTPTTNLANPQTVDARQSGAWNVGIDPAKNTVRVTSSSADPLPVKIIGSGSARKPFQARVFVAPTGTGFSSGFLPIPVGKRLVIENVSAIARSPEGMRMEINFYSYIDNNGDGVGDVSDIVFHRIALTDQGTFDGTAIASANHQVLVFADEQIGTGHFGVTAQARLNGTPSPNAFAQAQLTISGYLEDLPTP